MDAWTTEELDRIAAADELEIASVRADGRLRNPTTIWVVRLGDDLYVRSVRPPSLLRARPKSRWAWASGWTSGKASPWGAGTEGGPSTWRRVSAPGPGPGR